MKTFHLQEQSNKQLEKIFIFLNFFFIFRLAKIIVEIAKRDYPQEWPDFIEEIMRHWSQDILSKSKVCSFLCLSGSLI